ncbi:hypothetical protein [Streptomyces sp. NPDC003710]
MSAPSTREVYALVDADGTVRYVGQSADSRARAARHWGNARRYPADGRPLAAWLRTLDGPPAFKVLERVPVANADAAEAAWIRRLRRDPAACLVNLRPYEDLAGLSGVDPAAVARGSLARVSAALRGHPVSAETRRRLSLATRGRPKSSEHRAAISASVTAWHAARRLAAPVPPPVSTENGPCPCHP